MQHGRHLLFFMNFYVNRIDDVALENVVLFVRIFLLFCVVSVLLERFGVELFWWRTGRIRLWPWLLGLDLFVDLLLLDFFVHLPVLALLSFFLVNLFPVDFDFLKHFLSTLAIRCMIFARFPIKSTKLDSSIGSADRKTGIFPIKAHAWALYGGMKGLMSLFHPRLLLLKVTRGDERFFVCRWVTVCAAAIQLVQDMGKHLIKY